MAKSGKPRPRKSAAKPGSLGATRRPRTTRPDSESDAAGQAGGPSAAPEYSFSVDVVTELVNCLWYLKTKYFKRQWLDEDSVDPDPRARQALRRLEGAIKALEAAGIRLVDPTGTRYPPGAEAMMTALQFEPTPGIATDLVAETVRPMVFGGSRLIQRGEVIVSVPSGN